MQEESVRNVSPLARQAQKGAIVPGVSTRQRMSSVGAWRHAIAAALVVAAVVCAWPAAVQAATITVTTTSDDAVAGDKTVSLREAIQAINTENTPANPDITAQSPGPFGTNDAIRFSIPTGSGVPTINVGSDPSALGIPLPSLIKPVLINTVSPQPVVLDGTAAGATANGLELVGENISVNGLGIEHWSGRAGIYVHNRKAVITGNFIGTTFGATTAAPNANGIVIDAGSGDTIGGSTAAAGNVISGNAQNGILISNASDSLVEGNFIGTDASGGSPLFNGGSGVDVTTGATNNFFLSNTIGAATFPINMNGEPNHAVDDSFLTPQTVPSFVTGTVNLATLSLGSPVAIGANVDIPYTVLNGQSRDALTTMLYRVQCGTLSHANPLVDAGLTLSPGGFGSGTFTVPGPLPGGVLVGGGDGNVSATNLLNPCSRPTITGTKPVIPNTRFSPMDVARNPIAGDIKLRITPDGALTWFEVNHNATADSFVNSAQIIGLASARGSSVAIARKHKHQPSQQRFRLRTVTVMLRPGQKKLVRVPLTAKAKSYLKHDKAKTVTVKLMVTVKDPVGNHKTFTRTLTVKRHSQTTRKH
jgi:CSLREA domain-containing protein